ncbi:hypothetical protein HispidOSU_014422C [Sigmodon hispidus]
MSEYKTIVLLEGLESMDDYHFRTIKSLLRKELNLTKKMQDDFDRIQLADLMEDTFPRDSGLDKLIEVCQGIKELEDLAKKLKAEKAKVKKKKKGKNKTTVNRTKQDEPSSSQSVSTNNESNKNKSSSKIKRKQTMKTEGGKKKKLTQDQTQLPEPSGSITQNDEACLQIPQKPPPIPSSSSSKKKQKNTSIKKQSTVMTQVSQKKQQLLKLPGTGNCSAGSKLQTSQGLSEAASSSFQAPQTPLEACFLSKPFQGSPAPPCQNFPMSPASDSSIQLNSHVPLTQSSLSLLSTKASSDVYISNMSSVIVSSSLSAAKMSPVTVSSSVQNFHLPTAASFNSIQTPYSPQVTASSSFQILTLPSATIKNKTRIIKMPPATASSHVQVSHALPEAVPTNVWTIRVPQRATSNNIQFLNSLPIKEPRNVTMSVPLPTETACFVASVKSSPSVSSCLQVSQVLPPTTSKGLPAPQMPIKIETSRAQSTQMHTGAAANFIQVPHAPPTTVSSVLQELSSSTGQALPCPKVKAPRSAQAPPMPSAAASKNLLTPCASPPTTSSNLLAPRLSMATTSSALQVHPATPSNRKPRTQRRSIPKEPSREEGRHQGPKEVMVLKVTEPFTYDLSENKRMFHATVATENEFFRVKVFDTDLNNKFIPQKIIAISNYTGFNGFLEIYRASCVSDVNVNQRMDISNTLKQRAIATPKIKNLFSQASGTYVNGEFVVTKKNERNDLIYYEIGDDTGTMEVVVYGRLTSIQCEAGNKVRLVCFELTSSEDTWQLRSVRHSYMQVINVRRNVTQS